MRDRWTQFAAFVCLVFAVVVCPSAAAQGTGEYASVNWTIEKGLPHNDVHALQQTADGYLWIGTPGGLARFDGVRFTVFTIANTPALYSHRIRSLHEDRAGTLWIGTEHGGVARMRDGVFETVVREADLPGQFVNDITDARDGGVWIATDRGVVRFASGRVEPLAPTISRGAPTVHTVLEDRRGALWVSGPAGLTQFVDGVATRTFTAADGLPSANVRMVREDANGVLWVATTSGLARIVNGTAAAVVLPPVPERFVTALWIDAGTVWAGFADGTLVRIRRGASRVDKLQVSTPLLGVRALYVDRESNLWIATNSGLQRWRSSPLRTVTEADGLRSAAVMPIFEDRDGTIWIGTCSGPSALHADGTIVSYGPRDGLLNPCIRAIHQTRDGRLWMGAANDLFVFNRGRFTHFTDVPELVGRPVSAIAESANGDIWIGTASGVLQMTGQRYQWHRRADGLVSDDVRFLVESRNGGMWIGTVGGLSLLRDGEFTNYTRANGLPADFVRAVHEDADGTIWIGTYGGGLVRMKNGAFTRYTTAGGLPDDEISRILEDAAGDLWMSSGRGIFRVSRASLDAFADGRAKEIHAVTYGLAEGMPTLQSSGGAQPAGWRTRDGRLWFPTSAGAVAIDPKHERNQLAPPVAIEGVRVDDRPATGAALDLAPGRHTIEIEYTALSLAAPERVQFRYRLEGYDASWIEAGTRRTAYYTGIPPGRYRFQVIAANNDGVWNETGAALALVQQPHFYQTNAFYGLALIGLSALGFGVYRLRVRALLGRTRVLESTVAERTAEVVAERNKLADANTSLARANEDLLATLSGLRLGVIITAGSGRVAFVSPACQQLVGATSEEAAARHWSDLLGLDTHEAAEIERLMRTPAARRTKVPVRLATPTGRQYWMEVDVLDDPRDRDRRILFLYDVSEVYDLRRLLDDKAQFHGLIGQSRAMQIVYKAITDLGAVDSTVLIEGETGTGKELAARAIHFVSRRRHRPFVAVNCAALTESLLASQLFGHRRGAFTGAVSDQVGLFEAAAGGTVFLDEIGDVPPAVQVSLLRVLQEREVTRLGDVTPRPIDVRVIAASHRDLDREIAEGRFRHDLLYRIRVVRLALPPLRERLDDIPVLVAWFLGQVRASTGKPVHDVSHEAMEILLEHPWPGNVRELKSAIESAMVRAAGSVVQPSDLPPEILGIPAFAGSAPADAATDRRSIEDALNRAGGNRTAAARLLGISRATLYRRLAAQEDQN